MHLHKYWILTYPNVSSGPNFRTQITGCANAFCSQHGGVYYCVSDHKPKQLPGTKIVNLSKQMLLDLLPKREAFLLVREKYSVLKRPEDLE